MSKEYNQLKKQAAGIGLDLDIIVDEIVKATIKKLPPPVDEVALVEKIGAAVEAKIAIKLSEVLEAVKASSGESKPNTEGIIKGVAALLQPQIVEAAKQASEVVFAANSQALMNQIQEKLQEAKTKAEPGVSIGNMSAGGLIQALLANSEGIAKLISVFRPPPPPEVKAAELLGMSLRLAEKIDRVRSGKAQIDELTEDIQKGLTPKK